MANVDGAYCAEEDLRTGDMARPSYTSTQQYIKSAAEEIDAAIGHIYVTPLVIDETVPKNRPTILFLKKLNWLLASGRYMLDVSAADQETTLNAYGLSMINEAKGMLKMLTASKDALVLVGAQLVESDGKENNVTGPTIHNEDPESLVEAAYRRYQRGPYGLPMVGSLAHQVRPYGQ